MRTEQAGLWQVSAQAHLSERECAHDSFEQLHREALPTLYTPHDRGRAPRSRHRRAAPHQRVSRAPESAATRSADADAPLVGAGKVTQE